MVRKPFRTLAAAACMVAMLTAGCGSAPSKGPAEAPQQASTSLVAEVVAHRGGKPENSLAAFKAALAHPDVGAIELDVQVSSDGELFVIHDATVNRTTSGKGAVREMTTAQLRELKTDGADPIPTLNEVLALVAAAPGKRVFVEIKAPAPEDTPAKVLAALKKHGVAGRAVVASFDRNLVDATRKLDPAQATGFISKTFDAAELSFPGEYLMITYTKVSRDKLAQARQAGKKVYVWTIDEKASMETYLRMGADGVISNEYGLLAEVKKVLAPTK